MATTTLELNGQNNPTQPTIKDGLKTIFNAVKVSLFRSSIKKEIYDDKIHSNTEGAIKKIEDYWAKGGDLSKLDMNISGYNGNRSDNILFHIDSKAITPNLLEIYRSQGLLNMEQPVFKKKLFGSNPSINLLDKFARDLAYDLKNNNLNKGSLNMAESIKYLMDNDLKIDQHKLYSGRENISKELLLAIDSELSEELHTYDSSIFKAFKEIKNKMFEDKNLLKEYCEENKKNPNILNSEFREFFENLNDGKLDKKNVEKINFMLENKMGAKLSYFENAYEMAKSHPNNELLKSFVKSFEDNRPDLVQYFKDEKKEKEIEKEVVSEEKKESYLDNIVKKYEASTTDRKEVAQEETKKVDIEVEIADTSSQENVAKKSNVRRNR